MSIKELATSILGKQLLSLTGNMLDNFAEEIKQTVNNNILEYQIEEYKRNSFSKQSYTAQRLKNYPIFINLYLFEKLIIGDTINMDMINV